jgi:hypothetical protein
MKQEALSRNILHYLNAFRNCVFHFLSTMIQFLVKDGNCILV